MALAWVSDNDYSECFLNWQICIDIKQREQQHSPIAKPMKFYNSL